MSTDFANENTFDSREMQERIDELQTTADEYEAEKGCLEEGQEPDVMDEAEAEELKTLLEFKDDVSGSEWDDGVTFIRESYFEDYARELAEDIGAINADATWPCNCIDWEQAAEELQMDYSEGELEGITFYYR